MSLKLSPKQKDCYLYSDAMINVLHGSVRSGKTFLANLRFLKMIRQAPKGPLLLSGRTKDSVRENVLNDIFAMVGDDNYVYHEQKGILIIFGRRVEVFGAEKADSEPRIRGRTYAGWYGDEITVQHPSFVRQAVARCSATGAQIMWTTNPDHPMHHIKTDFLDNEKLTDQGLLKSWHFILEDNHTLDLQYIELLKASYHGVFYQRNILGLWVMAEGVIYSNFDRSKHVVNTLPAFADIWVGVDYGTSNATTFIGAGLGVDGRLYLFDEYYHSGKETGLQKSPARYSQEFRAWQKKAFLLEGMQRDPHHIFIDPAASGFLVQLWSDGVRGIAQADNAVLPGIELVSSLIELDLLRVHESCPNVLREFQSYCWDPKAQERGEDKPLKQFDHTMDAVRYIVNGTRGLWIKKGVPVRNAAA